MSRDAHLRRRARGFSLLEVAVVVGVIGLLGMVMTSAFENVQQIRVHKAAIADAEAARNAVRAFAMRNKRLPCPDSSLHGDTGREAGNAVCPAGVDIGWLPYESLGLAVPVRGTRLRYGVNRGAGSGLDPARPTPAATDGLDLDGTGGFIAALKALATSPAGTVGPYYVSQSATDPASTCTGDQIYPAFVIVAPGRDLEEVTGELHPGFDGPNRQFASGSGKCVAAPARPANALYDDIVVAESAHALLGWLQASTR